VAELLLLGEYRLENPLDFSCSRLILTHADETSHPFGHSADFQYIVL